jgi:hypothetical protein
LYLNLALSLSLSEFEILLLQPPRTGIISMYPPLAPYLFKSMSSGFNTFSIFKDRYSTIYLVFFPRRQKVLGEPGVVGDVYNPSIWEAEARGLLGIQG